MHFYLCHIFSKKYKLIFFVPLKYVPANRFKYIVKDVRRQRCREEEETVWASFVKQQELNGYDKNGIQPSVQSVKQLLDEGLKEADEELKRLETGILSGRIRKECSRTENNQKKKTKKVRIKKRNFYKNNINKKILITLLKFT